MKIVGSPNVNSHKKLSTAKTVMSKTPFKLFNVASSNNESNNASNASKQQSKNVSLNTSNQKTDRSYKKQTSTNIDMFEKFHINYQVIIEPNKDKDIPKTK